MCGLINNGSKVIFQWCKTTSSRSIAANSGYSFEITLPVAMSTLYFGSGMNASSKLRLTCQGTNSTVTIVLSNDTNATVSLNNSYIVGFVIGKMVY